MFTSASWPLRRTCARMTCVSVCAAAPTHRAPLIFDRSCRLRSSFCPAARYCLAPRRLYLIRFYRTVNAIRLLGHKKWALEILDQREVFVGLHVRCPPIPAECGPARRRYIIISARYTGNAHYICTAVLGSAEPPAACVAASTNITQQSTVL